MLTMEEQAKEGQTMQKEIFSKQMQEDMWSVQAESNCGRIF